MSKWRDRPHWEFDAVRLGEDAHGEWCAVVEGTPISRPGVTLTAAATQVVLSPRAGSDGGGWFMATFHDVGGPTWGHAGVPVAVYVDITTPPAWDGSTLRAVDLDLDVVRGESGRVWIDDEDEFAQHRTELGYPDEVVQEAMAACDRVHRAMLDRRPPYDGQAHLGWLDRARGLPR
jgi:hypothetical protein